LCNVLYSLHGLYGAQATQCFCCPSGDRANYSFKRTAVKVCATIMRYAATAAQLNR